MEINITTIALIITSVATVVYATLTYLLLMETRREKKKPIIEVILGVILYPLKYFLDGETTNLKRCYTGLYFKRGKFKIRPKLNDIFTWGGDALVYEDFRKSHPNIADKIDNHDVLITEIENKANAIARVLYIPKFKKKCNDLIDKWDKKVEEHRKISNAFKGDCITEIFLSYIVNNMECLPEGNVDEDFWKENHKMLFQLKDQLAKKQWIKLAEKIEEFRVVTEKFFQETEGLIEKYQKKYGISTKLVMEKYEVFKSII